MTPRKAKSRIDHAAASLRQKALSASDGTLLGSEDELVEMLAVSRPTMRQAARLLEREGLLRVHRGINGGYFAARPTSDMIESIVCAYLDTLGLDARHTGGVATALWVEALREASAADPVLVRALADRFCKEIEQLAPDVPVEVVSRIERESRDAVFELIDGRYIELVFRINVAFSRQSLSGEAFTKGDPAAHQRFVATWKKAKMMEFEAVASGDEMLAMMAALHNRRVWIARGKETGFVTDDT